MVQGARRIGRQAPGGARADAATAPRSPRPTPHGPRPTAHEADHWLLVTVAALVVFGTVMIFSASFAINLPRGGGAYYYLQKQLLWVALGAAACLATARVDYHAWRRYSVVALAGALALLVGVIALPGAGVEAGGARRWLDLGPLPQFQPSELAKMALVLYMADWLARKGPRLRSWVTGVLPFAALLGVLIFLVMLEPDLGTSALLAIVGITMFLVAGADLRQFVLFVGSGAAAFVGLALAAPYRRDRLSLFMKSEAELRTLASGWQLVQARLAIGSGGIAGLGLGASRQKYAWLPAAHTDAIFAVIGEELGLIGCACVLALFLLLAVRGYRVAFNAPDPFGVLLATGIVSWIVFQALINIGGITTTIPFTGVPLPFISFGGTSLIVDLAAVGILANVSRQTVEERGARGEGRRATGAGGRA
jgi:cell division protein FtsW